MFGDFSFIAVEKSGRISVWYYNEEGIFVSTALYEDISGPVIGGDFYSFDDNSARIAVMLQTQLIVLDCKIDLFSSGTLVVTLI